jgi:riboflavin kinase/FMN adenylyltransferase
LKILYDPLGKDDPPRGGVLSIGNFDSVHLGHQAVLKHLVERAHALATVPVAMTFEPHPVKVLRPREAPILVSTLEQRLQLIEQTGIEVALVVPFTHRLARMSADDFITRVLVDRLQVREVYIGRNFRFGADRGGDVELLVLRGRQLGFVADSAPIVTVGEEVVSSSRVRREVAAGHVGEAWSLLGRPVHVDGTVFRGERLGRKLGSPTLNIAVENELYPAQGVYVTAVHVPSFSRVFHSVTNVGVRPTVYESYDVTVESHLLDFSADLYDEGVRLYFLHRLRDEMTFPSTVQLMAQIRRDVEASRSWFDEHPIEKLDLIPPSQ